MQEAYLPDRDHLMKAQIFRALREMICGSNAVPLDKVTVKELSTRAGISTRTFYNHFSDKYAVVAWFMEIFGADSFAQIGITATPQEALLSYTQTLSRYGDFLSACAASKYYGSVYAYLMKLARKGLEFAASQHCPAGEVDDEIRLQIRYFAVAVEAIVSEWTSGQIDATEEQVANLMCSMIPHELYKLIETPIYGRGAIPWLDATKMRIGGFHEGMQGSETLRKKPDGTRLGLQ